MAKATCPQCHKGKLIKSGPNMGKCGNSTCVNAKPGARTKAAKGAAQANPFDPNADGTVVVAKHCTIDTTHPAWLVGEECPECTKLTAAPVKSVKPTSGKPEDAPAGGAKPPAVERTPFRVPPPPPPAPELSPAPESSVAEPPAATEAVDTVEASADPKTKPPAQASVRTAAVMVAKIEATPEVATPRTTAQGFDPLDGDVEITIDFCDGEYKALVSGATSFAETHPIEACWRLNNLDVGTAVNVGEHRGKIIWVSSGGDGTDKGFVAVVQTTFEKPNTFKDGQRVSLHCGRMYCGNRVTVYNVEGQTITFIVSGPFLRWTLGKQADLKIGSQTRKGSLVGLEIESTDGEAWAKATFELATTAQASPVVAPAPVARQMGPTDVMAHCVFCEKTTQQTTNILGDRWCYTCKEKCCHAQRPAAPTPAVSASSAPAMAAATAVEPAASADGPPTTPSEHVVRAQADAASTPPPEIHGFCNKCLVERYWDCDSLGDLRCKTCGVHQGNINDHSATSPPTAAPAPAVSAPSAPATAAAPPTPTLSVAKYCHQCGQGLKAAAKFCTQCATRQDETDGAVTRRMETLAAPQATVTTPPVTPEVARTQPSLMSQAAAPTPAPSVVVETAQPAVSRTNPTVRMPAAAPRQVLRNPLESREPTPVPDSQPARESMMGGAAGRRKDRAEKGNVAKVAVIVAGALLALLMVILGVLALVGPKGNPTSSSNAAASSTSIFPTAPLLATVTATSAPRAAPPAKESVELSTKVTQATLNEVRKTNKGLGKDKWINGSPRCWAVDGSKDDLDHWTWVELTGKVRVDCSGLELVAKAVGNGVCVDITNCVISREEESTD